MRIRIFFKLKIKVRSYHILTEFKKKIILARLQVTLFKYVFLTLKVLPDGNTPEVLGMGGSPSFCCKLSATTRNALRPILILSGVRISLKPRPTDKRSYTISLMAKSSLS